MKEHLTDELDQIKECPYCSNSLAKNEWKSSFEVQHHYKQTLCDKCNKHIRVKVFFGGSGHDCWDMNSKFYKKVGGIKITTKTLEKKLKEK